MNQEYIPKFRAAMDAINERIDYFKKQQDWLSLHAEKIEEIGLEVSWSQWSGFIDYDHLTREQTLDVIKAWGGTWQKEYGQSFEDGKINYIRKIDGMTVRIWSAPPPDSCQLIEEEIQIPEQVIPAHTEKKMKLVCQ